MVHTFFRLHDRCYQWNAPEKAQLRFRHGRRDFSGRYFAPFPQRGRGSPALDSPGYQVSLPLCVLQEALNRVDALLGGRFVIGPRQKNNAIAKALDSDNLTARLRFPLDHKEET